MRSLLSTIHSSLKLGGIVGIMQRSNSMLFANFNQDFTCVPVPFFELRTHNCFSQMYLRWHTERLQYHKL